MGRPAVLVCAKHDLPRVFDSRGYRCRKCRAEYALAQRRQSPAHAFKAELGRYGLTPQAYESMLAKQNGGCAICGAAPGKKRLNIDHDHNCCEYGKSCGKCVRGLLCQGCNTGLGHFRDSPNVMYQAINYLQYTGKAV